MHLPDAPLGPLGGKCAPVPDVGEARVEALGHQVAELLWGSALLEVLHCDLL